MFGEILNKTRKSRGITAQQMADHLRITLRSYQYYESNGRQPSFDMLVRIADKLNVTTDYLLGRDTSQNSFEEHID